MAYLLEFPPSTLPDDIRAPPYVMFGINGISAVELLPRRIPLNMVLYFAPKLAQWVLPAPNKLPPAVAQGVLHTPHVGIDILLDIGPASLQRIIFKMMQTVGYVVPKRLFQHAPSLMTSISIHQTWQLLELPPAGLDGLLMHMQARLMSGTHVAFTELRELWAYFPADHILLRLAAMNFVQAYIAWYYNRDDFASIRHWYLSTKERYEVFKAAEDQYPEFGKRSFPLKGHVNSGNADSRLKAKELDQALVERMDKLEARTKSKKPRRLSAENVKRKLDVTTTRQSLKIKVKSLADARDGADTIEMGIMSSLLDDALRKVQEERGAEDEEKGELESEDVDEKKKAESAAIDEKKKCDAEKDDGGMEQEARGTDNACSDKKESLQPAPSAQPD
ncbi:hypothetical protein CC86DRAFT_466899 [Ophiobolus disseminans]|uniref:Uncharacterized protein n=1 Tax=Ophiobolus disseminans TaxID=1469910 RepID=A0A6A6ZYN8_9PLEO|nr:hypothetical protein CC86DRAFT_466899 [Ophiobolus disseminans]